MIRCEQKIYIQHIKFEMMDKTNKMADKLTKMMVKLTKWRTN